MKKNMLIFAAFVLALSALIISVGSSLGWVIAVPDKQTTRWGNPYIVSYQGQIWDGETPYDGIGYFYFEIVDGSGNHVWSNDGGGPVTTAVPLTVQNGLFTVLLGDTTLTGMTEPLLPEVFYETDRSMRVWFSPDDVTFTQMPDQVIASVPYAYTSGSAKYAQYLGEYLPGDFQLRVSGTCTEGQMIKEILADGSVLCEDIPGYPTFSITELDTVGTDSSIAIGGDGLGLISYYDQVNSDLKVAHCENINCTSATTTTLDSEGTVGVKPSIAVGTDGFGLISYWADDRIKVAHCNNADCSDATISMLDTTGDHVDLESSIAIGEDGLGLIAYVAQFGSDTYIQVAHCSNIACSANSKITLQATNSQSPSLAIGADGRALISYYDYENYEYRVVHCADLYCYSSTINTIDDTDWAFSNDNHRYTDITIGEEGLGIVTYYSYQNSELLVSYCRDTECSWVGTYEIYHGGNDGSFPVVMTGVDGNELIVWFDFDQRDIKAMYFYDWRSIDLRYYMLDTTTTHEFMPSITLGTDGLGLISYSVDNHLSVIHCSNEFCMPINWEH